jgi:hypothetical protein
MIGRVWLFTVLFLVLAVASVACAGGGVALAVPSCQNVQAVAVQSYGVQAVQLQSYAPVAVAVPIQQRVQIVQAAPQYLAVQQVQAVQAVKVVRVNSHVNAVRVNNSFRTPFRTGVQAFRNELRR